MNDNEILAGLLKISSQRPKLLLGPNLSERTARETRRILRIKLADRFNSSATI